MYALQSPFFNLPRTSSVIQPWMHTFWNSMMPTMYHTKFPCIHTPFQPALVCFGQEWPPVPTRFVMTITRDAWPPRLIAFSGFSCILYPCAIVFKVWEYVTMDHSIILTVFSHEILPYYAIASEMDPNIFEAFRLRRNWYSEVSCSIIVISDCTLYQLQHRKLHRTPW